MKIKTSMIIFLACMIITVHPLQSSAWNKYSAAARQLASKYYASAQVYSAPMIEQSKQLGLATVAYSKVLKKKAVAMIPKNTTPSQGAHQPGDAVQENMSRIFVNEGLPEGSEHVHLNAVNQNPSQSTWFGSPTNHRIEIAQQINQYGSKGFWGNFFEWFKTASNRGVAAVSATFGFGAGYVVGGQNKPKTP